MKTISASIIILAAAILLAGGSHVDHGDTRLFLQGVALLTGLIGVAGWVIAFRKEP